MMMGVAFLLERSGVIVNSQTVADQDAAEVFSKLVKQKGKARTGFNPKTQQKIKIPAKTVVKFRVAKAAKDGVLGVKK